MKVLFAGGGTGGHLYPAIAVAKEICKTYPSSEILFAGNKNGIESELVPKEGFNIKFISSGGLSSNPIKALKSILKLSKGTIESLSLISKFRPDIIVGSGGYVSAPVTFAGKLKKIPVILLEQNTIPGKTNRLVGKIADKICASFSESLNFLPKDKTVITGNPVRPEILSAEREKSRDILEIPQDRLCLLVAGASQGAKSINDALLKTLTYWKEKNWTILHIAGEKHYKNVKAESEKILTENQLDYRCYPFMKDIHNAYAACDLAVCRAGATTIAEITARGTACVMVPYPHAAENHQEKNAQWLEKNGAGIMIKDCDVNEKFKKIIEELIENAEKRNEMETKAKQLGKPYAICEILKVLEEAMPKDKR